LCKTRPVFLQEHFCTTISLRPRNRRNVLAGTFLPSTRQCPPTVGRGTCPDLSLLDCDVSQNRPMENRNLKNTNQNCSCRNTVHRQANWRLFLANSVRLQKVTKCSCRNTVENSPDELFDRGTSGNVFPLTSHFCLPNTGQIGAHGLPMIDKTGFASHLLACLIPTECVPTRYFSLFLQNLAGDGLSAKCGHGSEELEPVGTR